MHLAVKSVDTVESTRPVRFLMIRGANKSIRDQSGHTPLDLINNNEVETENLANDLKKMLVSSLLKCLLVIKKRFTVGKRYISYLINRALQEHVSA